MSLRVYTLSAVSVTASAVAGLWLGVIIAGSEPDVVETAPPVTVAESAGSPPAVPASQP